MLHEQVQRQFEAKFSDEIAALEDALAFEKQVRLHCAAFLLCESGELGPCFPVPCLPQRVPGHKAPSMTDKSRRCAGAPQDVRGVAARGGGAAGSRPPDGCSARGAHGAAGGGGHRVASGCSSSGGRDQSGVPPFPINCRRLAGPEHVWAVMLQRRRAALVTLGAISFEELKQILTRSCSVWQSWRPCDCSAAV